MKGISAVCMQIIAEITSRAETRSFSNKMVFVSEERDDYTVFDPGFFFKVLVYIARKLYC